MYCRKLDMSDHILNKRILLNSQNCCICYKTSLSFNKLCNIYLLLNFIKLQAPTAEALW